MYSYARMTSQAISAPSPITPLNVRLRSRSMDRFGLGLSDSGSGAAIPSDRRQASSSTRSSPGGRQRRRRRVWMSSRALCSSCVTECGDSPSTRAGDAFEQGSFAVRYAPNLVSVHVALSTSTCRTGRWLRSESLSLALETAFTLGLKRCDYGYRARR
ncbi:hypothetical protein L227DRAFT_110104 [Lentinus tigrinus ALCF2SS1-6]|uniref:Uncharacterized protein n=1 Tax=Lentinus tigrinus ALCF2SS1-6 TaxID=1328759 RepID=A0A5C2RMG0_9APHY|nr:hypothetical protein L227DRAFT_110104 [Lentinus tigrinus ALCF2SS1-6]